MRAIRKENSRKIPNKKPYNFPKIRFSFGNGVREYFEKNKGGILSN